MASKIEQLHTKLQINEAEKTDIEKEVSRLDQLVVAEALMDAIKITARNVFYRALAPFKTAYNNYRDDHAFFRELTDSVV